MYPYFRRKTNKKSSINFGSLFFLLLTDESIEFADELTDTSIASESGGKI